MISGPIKTQIDSVWNAFWSGGISNPLEVIEQITYLLFLRRLDDLHTLELNKATRLKIAPTRRIFPEGSDAKGRSYEDFRWSRFQHFEAKDLFVLVGEHVFPSCAPSAATAPPTPSTWKARASPFPRPRC